jgi:hypothetical protein
LPEAYNSSIDIKTEEGQVQKMAKKKNSLALSCFTMAFTKNGIMGMISRSTTKEWPDVLAYLIVQNLMKRFRPVDTISKVKMRQRLNQITMKKGSNLSLLFEKLASIEDQYMAPGEKNQ